MEKLVNSVDLKSTGLISLAGSSPATGTKFFCLKKRVIDIKD